MTDIESRAATWTQPISAEAPCGTSSRYEEDYETMMTEISKLESVHSTPDWSVVFSNASSLLQHKTKDMAVLGSLCVALLKLERVPGLAAGLVAYRTLFEAHGPAMFPWPNRRRGRASTYSWMIQHLTAELSRVEPEAGDAGALTLCLSNFDRLDELLRPELDELHPRVSPLRQHLEDLLQKTGAAGRTLPLPAPHGQPEDGVALEARATAEEIVAHTASGPAVLTPAVAPFPPTAIHTEEEAREVVRKAAEAIKMAAEFFERRAEELNQDKERIEEQIRQAENVLQLQRHAEDLLEMHGGGTEELPGEGGSEGDGNP